MSYDHGLVERLRPLLAGEPDLTEKLMFGGVAFLLGGRLCCCAASGGDLLVRVDPADAPALLAPPDVRPMDMTGRPMAGWLLVGPGGVATPESLAGWVTRARSYVRTLPPKRPGGR